MATRKPKVKAPYKPPQYKLQVNSMIDIDKEINEIFNAYLADYCNRFGVEVTDDRKQCKIMVSLIQGGSAAGDMDGLCAFEHLNKLNVIAIQVRCMLLEGMEPSDYACQQWTEVLAHEFVHACQTLTGRTIEEIKYTPQGTQAESYYFDPDEVEARILQSFYANRMAPVAMGAIIQKIRECEDAGDEFDELECLQKLVNKLN